MRRLRHVLTAALLLSILVSGCTDSGEPDTGGAVEAVEYNLGEATIVQERFDEGDRFRDMPVRLNGMIAVPEGSGPFPVVMVLHGTHPGCPQDTAGVDRWPCDPEVEQENYTGFAYLLNALAEQGYVALAPNLNAENTFGFGEATPGERLEQLTDLHLGALGEATAAQESPFGVPLRGKADLRELALIGHSRGGEAAVALANDEEVSSGAKAYGPVAGTLLVAGASTFVDPWRANKVPLSTILAACDGDVTDLSGQFFYEGPRLAPDQEQWAASIVLRGATHNAFNTILPADMVDQSHRPDCATTLDAEQQRTWLAEYAAGFLTLVFSTDADQIAQTRERLGMSVAQPAPDEVLGQSAQVADLALAEDRRTVFVPRSAAELTSNSLGGGVAADGVTIQFCPKGFYTPFQEPGTEACRRADLVVPGQPALASVRWGAADANLRLAIPDGQGDVRGATALSLRTVVDPMSELNGGSAQVLTLRLTDSDGKTAQVTTRADEPALQVPQGEIKQFEGEETRFFIGIAPLTDIRIPLDGFQGVNLRAISEVAVVMDQTDSGAIFLADVAFVTE